LGDVKLRIKEYINIILKRWWIPLLVAAVAAGVAFGYSMTQPKTYEATAKIIGSVGKPDNGLYAALQQQINSYPPRFSSTDFATLIDQRGKFDLGAEAVIGKIKVQALPAQFTFVIQVTDTDAKRAADIANTAANILVDENNTAIANLSQDQQVYISNSAPASIPDRPTGPRTQLNTFAGLVIGLIIGLILIFAVEFMDDSLKDEDDVEKMTGLTIMGVVPAWQYVPSKNNGKLGTIPVAVPAADAGSMPEVAAAKSNVKEKAKTRTK
jgi:capsular polysaccharide biosynthesis protein